MNRFWTLRIFRMGFLTVSFRWAYLSGDATPENAFYLYGKGLVP